MLLSTLTTAPTVQGNRCFFQEPSLKIDIRYYNRRRHLAKNSCGHERVEQQSSIYYTGKPGHEVPQQYLADPFPASFWQIRRDVVRNLYRQQLSSTIPQHRLGHLPLQPGC